MVAIGMNSFCSLILTQGKVTCMFSRIRCKGLISESWHMEQEPLLVIFGDMKGFSGL